MYSVHSAHSKLQTMPIPRLEGKVAIITGAASGIGEAAARLFTANGAFVVIADVQDNLGFAVVTSLGKDKCSYKHCDVTDEKQVEATVKYALEIYGRLDIVYCNAGLRGRLDANILNIDKREIDKVMKVNVSGAAFAIKHGARAMIACGIRGTIVCTASVAGHQGGYGPVAYTVSKHALLGLVRAAAAELGCHGIRVNIVSPFIVTKTGMTDSVISGIVSRYLSNIKGVTLEATHIAEAAMFLASEESEFVSGHDLIVDGGTSVVYSGLSWLVALSCLPSKFINWCTRLSAKLINSSVGRNFEGV